MVEDQVLHFSVSDEIVLVMAKPRIRKARHRDWDILWVVLLAAACWGALWEHEPITNWVHKVWVQSKRQ
jgi:hypothetical protein